jgi:hypothetical protein
MRQRVTELNVAYMTASRVLHGQLLYPYHLHQIQALKPAECPAGDFVSVFVQQYAEPSFHLSVLFSDDAGFTRDSFISFHTHHQWAEDNAHSVRQSIHQQQFSINIWQVLLLTLVGKHVLPLQLTGNHYQDLMLNCLPDLLEDVPLVVREWMWFMDDGGPTHFSSAVRDVLSSTYHN